MATNLEQLYQQIILDHARERHGSGLLEKTGPGSVGESHQLNPVCGDEITLRTVVDGGTVASLSWDGAGCAISMASASVLTDLMEGLERDEAVRLIDAFREVMRSRGTIPADEEVLGDAAAFSGVSRYPARVKCAMLAWVALEESLLAANS
ncbi:MULTISPECIES: Fe-S cluster assembly sulfur transfer protein SufU [Arthrobacter]|uniref:SUF system NifU family Fe-S cluster assembly protein n=1 Tax=Arthrobacter crusticola TaxID=2547960 RepID=A0A4R5TZV7_9MICC|nr:MULTISPECIES: SUF system NifU family Fe-S cluster assembly protein [Arthrobacter]MBJ2121129.1 SUF system NifU family Fe-S cluster assembly protein [Arthrobacter sp. MSA 4-2]TDK26837.1 SUF system NifU family Fe-S cluster assembly protein [Arthrobacter crusticola]